MNEQKATIVLSNVKAQCVTFFYPDKKDFYIGYRFMEHNPEIFPFPLTWVQKSDKAIKHLIPSMNNRQRINRMINQMRKGNPNDILGLPKGDPWNRNWLVFYQEIHPNDPKQLNFIAYQDGTAWASALDEKDAYKREIFFAPDHTGIKMRMDLSALIEVPGAYCVQQCLRFSGNTNVEWRKNIAKVPFLSEYDLQATGGANRSLTYAIKEGNWFNFPVQYQRYHTQAFGTTQAEKGNGTVDHGLIVRERIDKKNTAGMYWERTVYVTNRHPADCVHASVDLGPVKAGESTSVYGKFYYIEGTKDDLYEQWQKDFT